MLLQFGYNQWANQRILAQIAKLSEVELKVPAQTTHGSAFELLLHTLDTEWGWRIICQDGIKTPYLWEVETLPDLDSLMHFWQGEYEQVNAYLQGLNDADLDRDIDIGTLHGSQPRSVKVLHLLLHILYHSSNHRSELAIYLTLCGHSPGDMDFLDYSAAQPPR
jgi:uncharacterized damage-inducible protein DinB